MTNDELIEDLTFLAATGVGFQEAARRCEMSESAVEARLRRTGRADLYRWLRALDPALVTGTGEAVATEERIRDWKQRQDARISRCPGCDQWCWDKRCTVCHAADRMGKAS